MLSERHAFTVPEAPGESDEALLTVGQLLAAARAQGLADLYAAHGTPLQVERALVERIRRDIRDLLSDLAWHLDRGPSLAPLVWDQADADAAG